MASSRPSSHGVDWRDVASNWRVFEETNNVHLTLRMSRAGENDAPDLAILVEAHSNNKLIGEAPALASQSVNLGSLNIRTMEAAILFCLYQIDFQLAEYEFQLTERNKSVAPPQEK